MEREVQPCGGKIEDMRKTTRKKGIIII